MPAILTHFLLHTTGYIATFIISLISPWSIPTSLP